MSAAVQLPAPLEHQEPVYNSRARFKVLRCGRRWGKTILAILCAFVGHGPLMASGIPMFPGIASGLGDVVWVLPTYKQRNAVWTQEIIPRFGSHPACTVNRSEFYVTLPNGCTLYIRSADAGAAATIRGLGKRVIGVVLDEAAHFDSESAWLEIIRPILIDNRGWAIWASTTNSGSDGHKDELEQNRTPSFFNLLCTQIMNGERSEDWEHFYGTAYDNPKLAHAEIDAALAEYSEGSRAREEEFFAKLLTAGAGAAFPEWNDDVHTAQWSPEKTPRLYRWSWMGDWGYSSNGGCWLAATSKEGRTFIRTEYYFRKIDPFTAGHNWGLKIIRFPRPEFGIMDTPGVTDGGPTILEKFLAGMTKALGGRRPPPLIKPTKSRSSMDQPKTYRTTAKMVVHELLRYERAADGSVPDFMRPLLTVHRTACPNMVRVMQSIQVDPKGQDDVDTKSEDHPYDALKDHAMMTNGAKAAELYRKLVEAEGEDPIHDPDRYSVAVVPHPEMPGSDDEESVRPFTTHWPSEERLRRDDNAGWRGRW